VELERCAVPELPTKRYCAAPLSPTPLSPGSPVHCALPAPAQKASRSDDRILARMGHANVLTAAASTTVNASLSSQRSGRPRLSSSGGSFHAGDIIPSSLSPYDTGSDSARRRSFGSAAIRRHSTHKYHTFPTAPPKTPSEQRDSSFARALSSGSDETGSEGSSITPEAHHSHDDITPLPWTQLCLLALLSLCEQTALNSISPYLPEMVSSFAEVPSTQTGLYVGILASAFALAQLATNLFWGYLSDTVGRKPVMLLGTAMLAVCFAFFGFCTQYWQVAVVHVAMGLLNGNAAVVPTCLGEVTDRTNQSRAFTWLPVMYSIGGITGPALGGLLVGTSDLMYPYLAPNIGSAALLAAAVIVMGIWFEETLEDVDRKVAHAGLAWIKTPFDCGRSRKTRGRIGSWSSRWPTREQSGRGSDRASLSSSSSSLNDEARQEEQALLQPGGDGAADIADKPDWTRTSLSQLLNRTTILVLLTYLVFQLGNISFNSLYPIFASSPPPTGRSLSPEEIGVLLSIAGLATIVFQVFVFPFLKARMGNLRTYRGAMLGIALSMVLMPWVGYLDDRPSLGVGTGKWWLYGELAIVLVIKNICAVGGLSSVLLLITNSAPSHETLGTLNGVAQTLSAAGRSVGPFLSGALFTLSTRLEPKGELLAWGLFGGITLLGWAGSLAIRGDGLESADWDGAEDDEDTDGVSTSPRHTEAAQPPE